MIIKEAQQIYREQLSNYWEQKALIQERQKKLQEQMKIDPVNKIGFEDEAAKLDLTYASLEEQEEKYKDYLASVNEQWAAQMNMVSTKQQGEAMEEYTKDMAKIMEVARRLMKGAIVPGSDEKKLMEFDPDLYMMAKNVGSLTRMREREKYASLWEDEEKKEYEDPKEVADNATAAGIAPAIVEASDIVGDSSEGFSEE